MSLNPDLESVVGPLAARMTTKGRAKLHVALRAIGKRLGGRTDPTSRRNAIESLRQLFAKAPASPERSQAIAWCGSMAMAITREEDGANAAAGRSTRREELYDRHSDEVSALRRVHDQESEAAFDLKCRAMEHAGVEDTTTRVAVLSADYAASVERWRRQDREIADLKARQRRERRELLGGKP